MNQLQLKLPTDVWITASWAEYIQIIDHPDYAKTKGYYYNGQMRIETMGVGPDHATDNTIVLFAINLFCTLKGIPLKGLTNCTYRKVGEREIQPDISYYIGDRIGFAPQGSAIADLNVIEPPDLAIEIADSSLNEDLGQKRLLYEEVGIREYWVIDVKNVNFFAFEIIPDGSIRISESKVIAGLSISVLAEALVRSRTVDQSQVGMWLLEQFR